MTGILSDIKPGNRFDLESVKGELGPKNLENLTLFSKVIKEEIQKQNLEAHLILVGGNVDPKRRGMTHKDIDLVFYSQDLCVEELCPKEDSETFAKFASFLGNISDKLGWEKEINKPQFIEFEYGFDGSVKMMPPEGVPLEILPVRADSLDDSFEDYLKNQERPLVVIF